MMREATAGSATAAKIRVLVVDDSALIRSVMSEIIGSQPDMEVVGVAPDPIVAREMIKRTQSGRADAGRRDAEHGRPGFP